MRQRRRKGGAFFPSSATQNGVANVCHQLGGSALVENIEMRWHARFQRKSAEEALTKGMDRLDLQPTRRFNGASKKLACFPEHRGVGGLAFDTQNLRRERPVVHHRPVAEALVKTRRHFGRRRLGESEAENAFGRVAGQQQPRHARRQCVRFAGARIGRHPDRGFGIGCAALGVVGA